MDWKNLLILISAGIYLFLGVFIYFKGKDKSSNRNYSMIAFSVFFWSVCMFMYRDAVTVEASIIWCRVLYTAPVFIVLSFLNFSHYFPEETEKRNRALLILSVGVGFLLILISLFSGEIVYNISIPAWQEKIIYFGDTYFIIYPLYVVVVFLWSYIILIKKIRQNQGTKRMQIMYVFWGTFISSTLSMITNLLLPTIHVFFVNWLGQVVSLIMVGFIAYAIVKHRLMDIKMVLRGSSVYLSSLLTTLAAALLINWIAYLYFPEQVYWMNLLILILAVSVFPSIKNKYFYWANKYFFSSLYDPQKLIAEVSENLRTTLQVDTVYRFIFDSLDKAFHLKAFGVLSYDEEKKVYTLDFNMGFEVGGNNRFEHNKKLHELFIGKNKTMITEELRKYFYTKKTKETIDMLTALKVEVLIPLNIKDRTVGLIALGAKESNDVYTDIDLQALEIVGAQAATVIENAHLYEETLNFNLKLKDEVAIATRDLVAANKKLIKLDEAKSEFISIASHQLRTPLTIIKGYISMILEGNFGELTPGEKDSLDKVYASNERLIGLVENLLNISRIESGRLQYDFKKMQLDDLVDSVVEELEPKAKGKGLKFTYKKTKRKLPPVIIDEEKVRQVVMNLVDNAIKYTKKGSVTITLKADKSRDPKIGACLLFCVADSGMGISAEDLPNLFKKFSRGTGSSLVHTEGTGLGLYVAKQMIEAHRGRVWAESEGENKGSKFCFKISTKDTPPPVPSQE